MTDLLLVPRPRELRFRAGGRARLEAQPRVQHDAALPAQGFEIEADEHGVTVFHADATGLRYARAALAQLREHDGPIDAFSLRDWPDFHVRGYMLDISRDRVPTRETLERLVGLLELLRINHLEL